MTAPIYIFAGGGTGGHLYPGLAVAEELSAAQPGARIVFACSNRPIDRRILDAKPYAIVPQPVRPLPRRPGALAGFLGAWRASRRLANDLIADLAPAAVLGLGGFAAGPMVRQAARAGLPTALLNPDAVPGKANAYLARRVDAIFTQFPATRERFAPRDRAKVRNTGCPVRPGLVGVDRAEAMAQFGLDPARGTLLVLGGSQGAASINAAVEELSADLASLADRWQVLHVTGPDKKAGVPPAAKRRGPEGGDLRVVRLEYCDRMDLAYAAADLALCRGGAVTIAELTATGTPAVVLPYPYHKDRQQHLNATHLADGGACRVVEDRVGPAENARSLRRELLPILADSARLAAMRQAACGFAPVRAGQEIARWLIDAAAR